MSHYNYKNKRGDLKNTYAKTVDYYSKRKDKLLAKFDKEISVAKNILAKKYNDLELEMITKAMRKEFEILIPKIPYIGGQMNSFTSMLVDSISILAMIRVLERKGYKYLQIGEFIYQFHELVNMNLKYKLQESDQDALDQFFGKNYLDYLRKLSDILKRKQYADDWVFEFIEGDGVNFDYGMNFTECGLCKVFKRLGAEKYVPFLCISDFIQANIIGFGFKRTQTIGNGAPKCDHRFLKYGTTPLTWPPHNLQEFKKGQS